MSTPSILFPPLLATGDTLGLVATASPPHDPKKIDEIIGRLTAQGFRVKPGKYLRRRTGYLAGSDEERAADLNAFFADPDVKGIFALRGGYGSCRILPLVDYKKIRANPKPFIGYSDNTALHHAILLKAGLVTFHGANASEAFLPENEKIFKAALVRKKGRRIKAGYKKKALFRRAKTLISGCVNGRLIGGNMTCLLRLVGTPYEPDFRNAILFLEDIDEMAYRVDGMFAHFRLAGIFSQIRGLVLGHFVYGRNVKEPRRIASCLEREAKRIGVPCVSNAPIGHFPEQIIVPHGVQAELNADKGELKLV